MTSFEVCRSWNQGSRLPARWPHSLSVFINPIMLLLAGSVLALLRLLPLAGLTNVQLVHYSMHRKLHDRLYKLDVILGLLSCRRRAWTWTELQWRHLVIVGTVVVLVTKLPPPLQASHFRPLAADGTMSTIIIIHARLSSSSIQVERIFFKEKQRQLIGCSYLQDWFKTHKRYFQDPNKGKIVIAKILPSSTMKFQGSWK